MKAARLAICVLVAVLLAAIPAGSQESIVEVVQKVKPAVVTVITYDDKGEEEGLGTGFFVSESHIITCFHVIDGAARAEVKSATGTVYRVKGVAGSDEMADVARLALEQPAKGAPVLTLAKSVPKEGERIVVVGSPLGLEQTVTEGIVSAVRDIPGMGKFIQLTAAISPGSSGSPVVDLKGDVIGVATSYLAEGQSLNFAVAAEHARRLQAATVAPLSPAIPRPSDKVLDFISSDELLVIPNVTRQTLDELHGSLQKGLTLFLKEDYGNALPHLQSATKADPSDRAAWFSLGYCYVKLGRCSEAIAAYKQAILMDPEDAAAHYNLGTVYEWRLQRYPEAIAAYKEAIRTDPDSADAHSGLGSVYELLDRYSDAIAAYKEAVRIDPSDFGCYLHLGGIYSTLHRYTEAVAAYKQAIRARPDYIDAHYSLGVVYLRTGKMTAALEQYKILKDLDRDMAEALFDLIYP